MSKRPRRPASKKSSRRPERRRGLPRRQHEPDLLSDAVEALRAEHPLELLALVSGLLAVLDPRARDPFQPDRDPVMPTRDDLMHTFFEMDDIGTSALLAAIAAMSDDLLLRRRVQREITERSETLPRWLSELAQATPAPRTVEVVHVLGDGDNVMVGLRLIGGHELTAVVYIDHNMGTVVKDAFVVPQPIDELAETMLRVADDPDTEVRELAPADARARIIEAVESGAMTYPPFETESWPACRPLVEWIVGLLPAGGAGYRRDDWDEGALAELTARFLRSAHGAGFDDPDHRSLLESLLWFGTDHGPGDPLRWSPPVVEILLLDWIPRKIVAEPRYLARVPKLLRAFIRFCHQERGIRPSLTDMTLDALDRFEREYQRTIRTPRPQGPAALLAAIGAVDPEGPFGSSPFGSSQFGEEPLELHEIMLDSLRRVVGGEQALDRLDAVALPDEDFAWADVPADIHDRVAEVLGLVDRFCSERTDSEFRTACRRLLARAACADPAIFRRRSRADTAAAAVCWIIGKANLLFDPRSAPHLTVKELGASFGHTASTYSQRSEPFLRAIGVDPAQQYGRMDLGSPDYLTGRRRAEIITDRDRYRAEAD